VVVTRGQPPVERGVPADVVALIRRLHEAMSFPGVAARPRGGAPPPRGQPWSKSTARRVAADGH
jgi:hypothetical protein